jgi:hypothetical protein
VAIKTYSVGNLTKETKWQTTQPSPYFSIGMSLHIQPHVTPPPVLLHTSHPTGNTSQTVTQSPSRFHLCSFTLVTHSHTSHTSVTQSTIRFYVCSFTLVTHLTHFGHEVNKQVLPFAPTLPLPLVGVSRGWPPLSVACWPRSRSLTDLRRRLPAVTAPCKH